jgi:hypothetical protein
LEDEDEKKKKQKKTKICHTKIQKGITLSGVMLTNTLYFQ